MNIKAGGDRNDWANFGRLVSFNELKGLLKDGFKSDTCSWTKSPFDSIRFESFLSLGVSADNIDSAPSFGILANMNFYVHVTFGMSY